MPQVTVYIRAEDLESWKALEKKSEFIHQALNGMIKPDKDSLYIDESQKRPIAGFKKGGTIPAKYCKNNHPLVPGRDGCIFKGCKFNIYK